MTSQEFVLPTSTIELDSADLRHNTLSPYKSPTKRIAERLHGQAMPPESPEMKFARNRLGDLLTSMKKEKFFNRAELFPGVSQQDGAEKTIVVEEEKRPGPGRPRRGNGSSKQKPGEVIFEMRGKPFSLREDRTSCTEYQLCRAWMRGNLKEEENWKPCKLEAPPDDSISMAALAARDIYALPRAISPYTVETEWPTRESLDKFDSSADVNNLTALRNEYGRHWKNVKRSYVHHARLRANRYHKSEELLSLLYNINC